MKTTITRRTKLGFGYTSSCENDENGNLRVCQVQCPDYTGTIKQVSEMIDCDRTLSSFHSGGTYYNTDWFVKIKNQWKRIKFDYPRMIFDLLHKVVIDDGFGTTYKEKYWIDELDIEVFD